jgi:hypothetical protein
MEAQGMNKKILVVFLFCFLLFVSTAFSHDGLFDENVASWDSVVLGHNDADPFKGWATVTVTNTMAESWGDFHFEIFEFMTYNVTFPTTATMLMLDNIGDPYSGYSYAHDGTHKLDFYFYGNPVDPGQTVTFKVYTDNTSNQHAWFGLAIYPTPVPEPATLALLSIGTLAFIRRR